jgi:hypothetical protein
MPAADSRAWLAKVRPPSTKISAWYIRLAPPLSTSDTSGSLFSRRQFLRAQRLLQAHGRHGAALDGAVAGADEHALAGHHADAHDAAAALHALLAVVVVHAQPGQRLSSRNSLPRSMSRATRSRGSSWPRCSNLSRLAADSATTLASSARTSARRSAMRAALAWKAGRARVQQGMQAGHHFRTSGVVGAVEAVEGHRLRRCACRAGRPSLPSDWPRRRSAA